MCVWGCYNKPHYFVYLIKFSLHKQVESSGNDLVSKIACIKSMKTWVPMPRTYVKGQEWWWAPIIPIKTKEKAETGVQWGHGAASQACVAKSWPVGDLDSSKKVEGSWNQYPRFSTDLHVQQVSTYMKTPGTQVYVQRGRDCTFNVH